MIAPISTAFRDVEVFQPAALAFASQSAALPRQLTPGLGAMSLKSSAAPQVHQPNSNGLACALIGSNAASVSVTANKSTLSGSGTPQRPVIAILVQLEELSF